MAYLNPAEAFAHLQDRVLDGIRSQFPDGAIKGRVQSLHLENLEVKDDKHPDDIKDQHAAKVNGETWSVPVFATLALKNNATGEVVSRKRVRVAEIPKTTKRYSYIVKGREYQVDNQWQLKPGVYARRRDSGELESVFNTVGRKRFDVLFFPESKLFKMEYNKTKIPVYPLLKTLGVGDDELEKAWGREIFDANKAAGMKADALEAFYQTTKKAAAPSKEEAAKHFLDEMQASKLRPDATEVTLGKAFTHVTGDALHRATKKLLDLHNGKPEDDRDSLIFKDLRTVGDFAFDKIRTNGMAFRQKVHRKLNTAKDPLDVIKLEFFNKPVREAFTDNQAARTASQINPLEMVSSSLQTTVMGPGGIKSERSVSDEAKFVNPSHLGFLDPIHTPEGEKTGVTLRLPIGVKRVQKKMPDGTEIGEAALPLYNVKTGKMELVTPATFMKSNVVLPDQVKWENGKPKPVSSQVRMATGGNNDIRDGSYSDAHYVMRYPSQLFNMTSNLIPFLQNTQGNRASMASRHIEQAISLLHREAPLVRVSTGVHENGHDDTFENLLGAMASHQAPAHGTVKEVTQDHILISGKDGKDHKVSLYNNYPLNDPKSVMHSTPLVKAGDTVRAGQTVADTNFAKKGTLALGTNLRVGYVPFKGYNFEDGIVISDSAAKKLSSEHLHKESIQKTEGLVLSKQDFRIQHPGLYSKDQLEKLGDDGVVRVGQRVLPGDPLIAATKKFNAKDKTGLRAIQRGLTGAHNDKSLRWSSDFEGEVTGVYHTKDGVQVHVRTVEPMQVGDKMAGRYGNKGIVTQILPDHEMPRTKDGKHIEVALNPSGVPGRMNVGQVLETAAAKIAEKTGKPYVVKNFEPNVDYLKKVQQELKSHGLSDTEELLDPVTKQSLGQALVGPQHMLKLVHQVDKKLSVRSGMNLKGTMEKEKYDLNLQPMSGGHTGGQSMGTLGLYAMLAHGAKANIREMQSYKSEGPDPQVNPAKRWASDHDRVWAAITTGHPLPVPKPTFAFQKFQDYLKGVGINMEKKGHDLVLTPLTDAQIREFAKKELPKPAEIVAAKLDKNGDLKPKPGGLFDEQLTGGHGGRHWTRISLAEPMPNPVFEDPVRHLLGMKKQDFFDVVHGVKFVSPSGHITEESTGLTGGHAIKNLLEKIDVKKELATQEAFLKKAPKTKLDDTLKKVKYLRALDELNMKPSEAYILHNIPVIPPALRPVSTLPDGALKFADINQLYSDFAKINDKLKDPTLKNNLTDKLKVPYRKSLYDGVRELMGIGITYKDAKYKGLLHQIAGASPKSGYFQDTLVNRRQDLTMRSTIVPEPRLQLDEVGIPRDAALDLFRPFVIRELKLMGAVPHELAGAERIKKKDEVVWRALDRAMTDRPVLMKRDPALHKYSVQAFKARPVHGSAIQIHPLVTSGYNADFDGDTMSVFVPITDEAKQEAKKMFPSNNLFSEATGKAVYQPTLESALGLFKLSDVHKETNKKFSSPGEAILAVRRGEVKMNDVVHVEGKKTTPGRVLLASAVPEAMRPSLLHNLEERIDRKGLDSLLTKLGKNHSEHFGEVVNRLKDLGNGASFGVVELPKPTSAGHSFLFKTVGGSPVAVHDAEKSVYVPMGTHSLSLKDFETDRHTRDKLLSEADKKVVDIRASKSIPHADKDRRVIEVYSGVDGQMKKLHEERLKKDPTNLFTMYRAGVKPGWDQYKQMVLAPMLLKDSADRTIPTPVTKSYSEGLDVGGYWTQMHGARRGSVMKVQEVREPGAMSKLLMNSMMHLLVNSHDCGTTKGIALDIHEPDIHDRFLQQDFNHGNLHIPTGTPLTPDVVSKIRAAKSDARVVVRSPMKCEEEHGVCQRCIGLGSHGDVHPLGTNIGVQSAHTVGERAVQLTLKSFHTGGVVERGGPKLLNSFARFEQLMLLPKSIPNEAALAMTGGKVEKIQPTAVGVDVYINGKRHHVGKDLGGMPLHVDLPGVDRSSDDYRHWEAPKVGMTVKPGQFLSDPNRTFVNPHRLYKATSSMEQVQNHLANEVYDLYKKEGIKRRHVETVVRAMGNLTEVVDPGDHEGVLRGEYRPLTVVQKMNSELVKQGKKPIEHKPTLKGINVLPLEVHEDWMAKLQHQRLRETILDAAANNAHSNIHGTHPIPGIAFGAEFGVTSQNAARFGKQHDFDKKPVPGHHY